MQQPPPSTPIDGGGSNGLTCWEVFAEPVGARKPQGSLRQTAPVPPMGIKLYDVRGQPFLH